MNFNFSKHGLEGKEKVLQRIFEIIPGLMTWTILIGAVIISIWKPLIAAVLIIAFDFYWILKLFYLTFFLIISYHRLSIEKDTDWMERMRGLDDPDAYIKKPESFPESITLKQKLSRYLHRKEVESFKKKNIKPPLSESIYQLVIIPVAKETEDIVGPGIKSLSEGTFSSKRMLVVLAVEDRADDNVKKGVENIQSNYKDRFLDLLVKFHKDGVPGEARVKGANATNAAKEAAEYIRSKGIPFENVIVSCFDSDTVVEPSYFACLTYNFMICPYRTRASFQPIPVYYNNIWDVPGFARVLETGSSFFQLIEATNPEKMVTFSSHSMSFKALVDAGYWPVDMISDDSAIYWKSYIEFDGNYAVVPIYTTVSMDIVAGDSWMETIKNEYKQKRRWAWGVENFPIVMRGFLKNKKITLFNKLRFTFKLLEGHIAWATWAFLLTFIGWLPALFAGKEFHQTVTYYNAPRITAVIFELATFSLIASIILSILLLPKRKVRHLQLKKIIFAFQWIFVPLIYLFLSAIPALDAQTKLMLGKRMEFWVAKKKR